MSYGVPLLIFSISNTFSFLITPAITTFQASRRSLFGSIILLSSLLLSWPIIIITAIIMEDNGGIKLTGIKQIVRLKELLQKWQSVALSPKGGVVGGGSHHQDDHHHRQKSHHLRCLSDPLQRGGISPAISRRLMGASAYCDSDEESSCQSPEPPHGVPKGYLAVYVGPELRRFIIPTSYLTEPVFKVLLEKVEEEFGFDHSGGLTIPCEIETFKYLLNYLETHQNATDHHHRNSNHSAPAGTSVAVEE